MATKKNIGPQPLLDPYAMTKPPTAGNTAGAGLTRQGNASMYPVGEGTVNLDLGVVPEIDNEARQRFFQSGGQVAGSPADKGEAEMLRQHSYSQSSQDFVQRAREVNRAVGKNVVKARA